jgi:hypothetical protein
MILTTQGVLRAWKGPFGIAVTKPSNPERNAQAGTHGHWASGRFAGGTVCRAK